MKFPVAYETINDSDLRAAVDVLTSGRVTMGEQTRRFEDEFAEYVGAKHAVMVNSGSSADFVMMLAAVECGILKRDEEITMPAVTWPTQAWAALFAGLRIRLIDVDSQTLQAPAKFAVHLLGNPYLCEGITPLFEDCCEALGAKWNGRHVGTFGKAGTFSFFFSHHITTIEGGMIVTDDEAFADACRMIRAHGWIRDLRDEGRKKAVMQFTGESDGRFTFISPGLNFRPTEISAALGRSQLKRVDDMNAARRYNFEQIASALHGKSGEFSAIISSWQARPSWFCYPVVLREIYNRADCVERLAEFGIETRPIMGGNLAMQPVFQRSDYWGTRISHGELKNASAIHRRGFYVGLPPVEMDMFPVVQALGNMNAERLTKVATFR